MSAEAIAKALGGPRAGGSWMARCPAHEDREPSLAIADGRGGKVLVRCHAGCEQRDAIDALRTRGIWDSECRNYGRLRYRNNRVRPAEPDWRASQPVEGTPVATYLRSRGITISPPRSIRYHARLKHPSGAAWPAMVALVTRGVDDEPIGVHRTFLAPDGKGKAPVKPTKMMLGPCRGGAVRFADLGELLMVGEGIETTLAVMQATGLAAWAALSTSGLRALELPRVVRDVIVLADGDAPGEAAAKNCAWRWKQQGRRVRIARPPRGMDFNDLLVSGASLIREGAQ